MGNRATVIFQAKGHISPAVYLHWNGGPESVYQFLDELDRRKVRADADYEAARFVQLVGEYFDQDGTGSLSLGLAQGPARISPEALALVQTDHGDNGFYVVDRSGKAPQVRRFTAEWDRNRHKDNITELAPAAVETERIEARRHEYATKDGGFAEFYKRIHPTIHA